MLTHLGSLTIRQCVPMLSTSKVHLDASIGIGTQASAELTATLGVVLPQLQGKLVAAQRLLVSLQTTPPSLLVQLEAAKKLVIGLEAAIAAGLPGVSFQVATVLQLIVSLQAQIAALTLDVDFAALLAVEVNFSVELELLLGTPGIHAYAYTGAVKDLGDELAAATDGGFPGGSGSDACAAVIFAASDGGAIAALATVFATAA